MGHTFKRSFFGNVLLTAEGGNIERFLTEITRICDIYDVERQNDGKIIFRTDYKNVGNIFAFADEKCYNVTVIRSSGLIPAARGLLKRAGLIAGAVLFLCLLTLSYLTVYRVEINVSGGEYNTALIEEKLDESGLVKRFKTAVDLKELQKFIYLNFEDISYVSCSMQGGCIKIEVVPSLVYQSDSARDEITASFGGVVDRVMVYSGTALVKKGDIIAPGDVLISGDIGGVKVPAIGEVYVRNTLTTTLEVKTVRQEYVRTGNYVENKVLDMLLFQSKVHASAVPYAHYETEESEYYLFGGSLLPFKMKVTRYYELTSETVNIDFESEKSIHIEKAKADALLGVNGDYEITDSYIEITDGDGCKYINVLLVICQLVGGK